MQEKLEKQLLFDYKIFYMEIDLCQAWSMYKILQRGIIKKTEANTQRHLQLVLFLKLHSHSYRYAWCLNLLEWAILLTF